MTAGRAQKGFPPPSSCNLVSVLRQTAPITIIRRRAAAAVAAAVFVGLSRRPCPFGESCSAAVCAVEVHLWHSKTTEYHCIVTPCGNFQFVVIIIRNCRAKTLGCMRAGRNTSTYRVTFYNQDCPCGRPGRDLGKVNMMDGRGRTDDDGKKGSRFLVAGTESSALIKNMTKKGEGALLTILPEKTTASDLRYIFANSSTKASDGVFSLLF